MPEERPFDHTTDAPERPGRARSPSRVFIMRRRRAAFGVVAGLAFLIGLISGAGDGDEAPADRGAPEVHALSAPPDARDPQRAIASGRREDNKAIDNVLVTNRFISRGSRQKREVALTFDDGPSPYTPQVLKILRERDAPATFFIIGRAIDEFGERYLPPLVQSGFPIGGHTQNHPALAGLARKEQLKEVETEIEKARRFGVPYPRLFRPPQGSFNGTTLKIMKDLDLLMVLWGVDTSDFTQPGAAAIVERAVKDAKPGSIILMHDGGGNRAQTVAALPKVIDGLRKRGFKLVTVPQLLRKAPPPEQQTKPGDPNND